MLLLNKNTYSLHNKIVCVEWYGNMVQTNKVYKLGHNKFWLVEGDSIDVDKVSGFSKRFRKAYKNEIIRYYQCSKII